MSEPTKEDMERAAGMAMNCLSKLRDEYPGTLFHVENRGLGIAELMSKLLNLPLLLAAERERDELRKQLDPHMPGAWTCPKCNFTLQKNVLSVTTGNIGADTSPLNEVCPNDGQLMKPLTWREANELFWENNQTLRSRVTELEKQVEALKAVAKAAKSLEDRLERIHRDPLYQSVWFSFHNHGGDYSDGPKYDQHQVILNKALTALRTLMPEFEKGRSVLKANEQRANEQRFKYGDSVFKGETWEAFRIGEDARIKDGWIARRNGSLEACFNDRKSLVENAKRLGVKLKWKRK